MFNWFVEQLSNPMFSGLIGAATTTFILYSLREIPGRIFNFIKDYTTFSLVILNDDNELFDATQFWLSKQKYNIFSRSFRATTFSKQSGRYEMSEEVEYILSHGYGNHLFKINGKWYLVNRYQEKTSGAQAKIFESIRFTTLGWNIEHLKKLLNNIKSLKDEINDIPIFTYQGWWKQLHKRTLRSLDSVILPLNQKKRILDDITKFLSSMNWYLSKGIPYKRTYLFSGNPGCGKTSFILAIAGWLKKPIYFLSLSAIDGDNELINAFINVPKNAIVVLEDIDAIGITSKRIPSPPSKTKGKLSNVTQAPDDETNGITLSGLLNILDGILTSEGRIIIMTTNHPEKLDSALLRDGRVDVKEEIEKLNHDLIREMYIRFFPKASETEINEFVSRFKEPIAASSLQEILIKMENNNDTINAV